MTALQCRPVPFALRPAAGDSITRCYLGAPMLLELWALGHHRSGALRVQRRASCWPALAGFFVPAVMLYGADFESEIDASHSASSMTTSTGLPSGPSRSY